MHNHHIDFILAKNSEPNISLAELHEIHRDHGGLSDDWCRWRHPSGHTDGPRHRLGERDR